MSELVLIGAINFVTLFQINMFVEVLLDCKYGGHYVDNGDIL